MLGNWLIANGRVEDGCQVLELYLKHWSDSDDAKDIALLIAAKYVRSLGLKEKGKVIQKAVLPVRFVPLTRQEEAPGPP